MLDRSDVVGARLPGDFSPFCSCPRALGVAVWYASQSCRVMKAGAELKACWGHDLSHKGSAFLLNLR